MAVADYPPAAAVFGERLGAAERYAALLADAGVKRGLIGPREADRLWERHLLNSAAVGELLRGRRVSGGCGQRRGPARDPVGVGPPGCSGDHRGADAAADRISARGIEALGLEVDIVRGRAEEPSVRERAGGSRRCGVSCGRALGQVDEMVLAAAEARRIGCWR